MRCLRCNRPLKRESATGMGPVCGKRATATIERDLFGFDIDRAVQAARVNLALFVAWSVLDARVAIRDEAAAALQRRMEALA